MDVRYVASGVNETWVNGGSRMKALILTTIIFLLTISARAAGIAGVEIKEIKTVGWDLRLRGQFSKPADSNPGDIIYGFLATNSDDIFTTYSHQYQFIGRTGEKTFELLHEERKNAVVVNGREVFKYHFEENGEIPLEIFRKGSACTDNDMAKLKMLKLSGNMLLYKVTLPPCLVKHIPSKNN